MAGIDSLFQPLRIDSLALANGIPHERPCSVAAALLF